MSSMNNTHSRSSIGSHDRKLRYRTLLEDLSTLEDESDNNVERMEKTACAVKEAQALLAEGGVEERVRHPGEGYLDSRVLRATSDLAVRCSEAVSGNVNTYDRHALAHHIRENPEHWLCMFPGEVPPLAFLFGTFAAGPPELRPRAARRRVDRQRAGCLLEPEAVDRLERTEEGSETVSRVYRLLNKVYKQSGPVNYFQCVLDPGSFSRTIENVYHVSFLARDGMVSIDIDEEHGLPMITPLPPAQEQGNISEEKQFVISIDMKRWQDLVEALDIRKPMLVLKRS